MNPNEVAIHEMQSDGVAVIIEFLRDPFVRRVNRRICILMVRF